MKKLVNWEMVNDKINNQDWAGEFFETTAADLDKWIENYHDEAERKAGWFHDYNCEKCSGRLKIDLEKSGVHECPACGHFTKGEDP